MSRLPPHSSVKLRPPVDGPFGDVVSFVHRRADDFTSVEMAALCGHAMPSVVGRAGASLTDQVAMLRWLVAHASQWLDEAEHQASIRTQAAAE